jgi:hypothetical protein
VRGFSGYGLSSGATFISASGGTTVDSGNYRYHTFSSSGTFTVSAAPSGKFIDFIIVAGGGGADLAAAQFAAGGAGGVVEKLAQPISTGSFTVTIGAGGAFSTSGGNSLFKGETAIGGGRGNSSGVGFSGGSGGGGTSGGAALQPSSASGGYGYAGNTYGGGGAGSPASGNTGGDGYESTTFGDLYGQGGSLAGDAGVSSRPGGGGGANTDNGVRYASTNGIVIIRYLYQ